MQAHEDRPADDFDPDAFDLDAFDLDAFESLILLSPTCQTEIDKDPKAYLCNILLDWKANHLA